MNLKSKVLVGTILLLCSMSMVAGCLGEENTRKEKVSIKVFVDAYCPETGKHRPEDITPNDFWLSFTEAGYERVSFTFEEGGYIAKYVLDKCITPDWIEVRCPENTTGGKWIWFTFIVKEWPVASSGTVYIIYDVYIW